MALHGKSGGGGRLSGCEQSNHMHPLKAENFVRLVAEREVSEIGAQGGLVAGSEDEGGPKLRNTGRR